ncbi:MAG: hypothetical protein AB1606_08175 [Nitrospirota bacterium]
MGKSLVPDYITPITGWRFWRIFGNKSKTADPLWLGSIVRSQLWPPKERLEAECGESGSSHTGSLKVYCKWGISAYKSFQYALEDFNERVAKARQRLGFEPGTVLGKVKLWGKIHQHQYGYRAQFAYPFSLVSGVCINCLRLFDLKSEDFILRYFTFGSGWLFHYNKENFPPEIFPGELMCSRCIDWIAEVDLERDEVLSSLEKKYGIEIEESPLLSSILNK